MPNTSSSTDSGFEKNMELGVSSQLHGFCGVPQGLFQKFYFHTCSWCSKRITHLCHSLKKCFPKKTFPLAFFFVRLPFLFLAETCISRARPPPLAGAPPAGVHTQNESLALPCTCSYEQAHHPWRSWPRHARSCRPSDRSGYTGLGRHHTC
jgi:hypothetical protein